MIIYRIYWLTAWQSCRYHDSFGAVELLEIHYFCAKTSVLLFLISHCESMNYECNKRGFNIFCYCPFLKFY
jgi:hypothetical protein